MKIRTVVFDKKLYSFHLHIIFQIEGDQEKEIKLKQHINVNRGIFYFQIKQ